MIRDQKGVMTQNCYWRGIFSGVAKNLLLILMIMSLARETKAIELSAVSAVVKSSNVQRIFDTNETILLIGKNADYGPSESDKRTTYELWMLDIHTKAETLIKTRERIIEASLSPVDGRIAYITENSILWVTDASAENSVKLYKGVVSGGAWSPDGSKLAFTAEHPSSPIPNPDIFVAETKENGVVTQLTTHINDDDIPVWSPDGTHILFVSGRTGVASLWIVQADGNSMKQVTNRGIMGGKGKSPKEFIPVPVFDKATLWPEQGKIYFHSGDELWVLQGDQTTTERSIASAKTVSAAKLKPTDFPAGLFMINTKPTLWLKEGTGNQYSVISIQ